MVPMVKQPWWKKIASLLLVALFAEILIAPSLEAAGSGQGLELSPPVIELQADPGQTVTGTLKLRNITKSDLIAKPRIDDFGAKGEDGQPQILLNETESTRYSLKYWVAPIPQMRLTPSTIQNVSFTISVPKNAEPGGHFGVIRFTAQPPELEGTGVALSASIGALVLLRVSGPITEKSELAEFGVGTVDRNGTFTSANFFEYGPVNFLERIRNTGSVHVRPQGTVDIFDIFNRKVASIAVNDKPGGNVLPSSVRRYQQEWNKRFLIGPYRARMNLTYGSGGTALTSQSIVFWVLPWKLLLISLLALLVLLFGLRIVIKRYNAYIIRQSSKTRQ
jgi:hypothetical protein